MHVLFSGSIEQLVDFFLNFVNKFDELEYFYCFTRLLNYGRSTDLQLGNATKILEQELLWIKNIQVVYCIEICIEFGALKMILCSQIKFFNKFTFLDMTFLKKILNDKRRIFLNF